MSRSPVVLAVVLTVVAVGAGVLWPAARSSDVARPVGAGGPVAAAPAGVRAAAVLASWDDARSRAWAAGSPRLLRGLYVPGSVAGRRDRSMLRAWRARGLVVRGLHTQLLAVRELTRSASAWTLRVTDRLAGGVAVGRGVRRPLPVDSATTRTIELRLVDGSWRVASVSPIGG